MLLIKPVIMEKKESENVVIQGNSDIFELMKSGGLVPTDDPEFIKVT